MKLRDLKDPALHVPLVLAIAGCFWVHPILGCIVALWIREAAQQSPGKLLKGLDLRAYTLQRHLEIWPPGIIAGIICAVVT